ncbi:MAG TPA: CBS domain-containing protein [Elusimicrobiota bacterium]|nr:CBS domain-containing protein [Elusimicrobiota bacterium]
MKVKDIMTQDPIFCTPQTGLQAVAHMMCDADCGEIPIVESPTNPKPVGVITDRDITCRAVAEGKNPLQLKAQDCMSSPVITVTPETELEECCQLIEQRRIRRVLVVDEDGRCCGIVSQADIARRCPPNLASEVVKEVSQPAAA